MTINNSKAKLTKLMLAGATGIVIICTIFILSYLVFPENPQSWKIRNNLLNISLAGWISFIVFGSLFYIWKIPPSDRYKLALTFVLVVDVIFLTIMSLGTTLNLLSLPPIFGPIFGIVFVIFNGGSIVAVIHLKEKATTSRLV